MGPSPDLPLLTNTLAQHLDREYTSPQPMSRL
jgi:hypothetical protein